MHRLTSDGVERHVLGNGLRVLVKENHASAVAAVVAHIHVGYFHEPNRLSGISHVIEHMVFKGSRRRPGKDQIAEVVRAMGGSLNAATYYEDTAYHIAVPSVNLGSAIEIQADMLRQPLLDGEELAKELEVIIQESKQKRDNPRAMLLESLYALAFDRHRIRRWRIGEDEALRALGRDDLLRFAAGTYRPENIVISLVGDFDAQDAVREVDRWWGDLERGSLQIEASPAEPERTGFRYERRQADVQQRLLAVGFPAPDLFHPDSPALLVLDGLLSDGRSSRLYRSLKEERQIASSTWANYEGFRDLGILTLGAEAMIDDPLPLAAALLEETGRLMSGPISSEELARVKTRIESRRLFAQEEVVGIARTLAWYEARGDFRFADEMVARLLAVDSEDVRRAAATYPRLDRATLLEYLPNDCSAPVRTVIEVRGALESSLRAPEARILRGREESAPSEFALTSGGILAFRQRSDLPIVAIHVLFTGGRRGETPGNAGISNLMLKSALKGTRSFRALEISEGVESLGSSIGLAVAPDYLGFSLKTLSDRFEDGWRILREVIACPTFPPEEVEKEKAAVLAEIRRQRDSMYSRAADLFARAAFGDLPYGLPASGDETAVLNLRADDMHRWRGLWIRRASMVVAAVGDIEKERIADLVDELELEEGAPPEERASWFAAPSEHADTVERHQTASFLGFAGAALDNDDRHALDLLAEITSGLAGRFFQAVRGESALAYAVSSFHRSRRDAGIFGTYTATSPDQEEAARDILLAECARLSREPVTPRELEAAKEAIRGEHVLHTQTFSAQAGEMAVCRLYGLPLNEPELYLHRMGKVSAEDLQGVAGRYLQPQRCWRGIVRGNPPA